MFNYNGNGTFMGQEHGTTTTGKQLSEAQPLAFVIGTVSGLVIGLWLALNPVASALCDPYIKALNSMPRVILAPIFSVWFGLDIASKVALGVTLVFFIVFFNVYQGVKEVSPVVLANARMLGGSKRQLLRYIYLPTVPRHSARRYYGRPRRSYRRQ